MDLTRTALGTWSGGRHLRLGEPLDEQAFMTLIRKTLTEAGQSDVMLSGDRTLPILLVEDTEDLRDASATTSQRR